MFVGLTDTHRKGHFICSSLPLEDVSWGRMGMFIKIYVAGQSFLVLGGLINMLVEHFRGG